MVPPLQRNWRRGLGLPRPRRTLEQKETDRDGGVWVESLFKKYSSGNTRHIKLVTLQKKSFLQLSFKMEMP